ncbi:hypothetical protein F5B20DRAFT_488867 [Whalleya microplaca]|nr:hypothetical protein F5B20DRAFT_488867 [Whalleya microplaca]
MRSTHDQNGVTHHATTKLTASEDLLKRAKSLQSEIERFGSHLEKMYDGYFQHVPAYMYSSFNNSLRAEIESLERAVQDLDSTDPLAAHRAQSTNLPFLEPVWDTAKRSRDIVKLRCAVSGPFKKQVLAPGTRIVRTQGESQSFRAGNLVVDVVADGGQSWYKVSSMTNKRLLFDMAKEAVYCGDSDEDEADVQDYSDIPLLKLARNLAETARGYRIQNRSPTVYLVLPRIILGEHAEVNKILDTCRSIGIKCNEAVTTGLNLK